MSPLLGAARLGTVCSMPGFRKSRLGIHPGGACHPVSVSSVDTNHACKMTTPPERKAFTEAAARATRRLALADWCALLARTAVPVFVAALVLWAVLRRCGVQDRAWWALALIPAWLAANALVAWLRRPAPFEALAAWDRAAGRREMFASAWFFENADATTAGATLHLARAHVRLGEDRAQLNGALPLRFSAKVWIAPLLFAAFAISGWLRLPISVENLAISPEARARAAKAGADLAKQAAVLNPLTGLSDEEKKRLEQLRAALDETAKKLGLMETPRDLLEELERRAREAEKIAEQLRAEDPGALSSTFLAELERNADTADLGAALRAQDLGRVAEEARALQAKLGQQGSLEEQKRLEDALKRALEAANEADRKSKAGEKLGEAEKQLAAGDRAAAAQKLAELAEQFERAAQRMQAQNQLRDIAQNFRAAGGQILGGQNLQRLELPPSGMFPLSGIAQFSPGMSPLQQGTPLTLIPFSGDLPPGDPNAMLLFPVPGTEPLDPNAPLFLIPGGDGHGDGELIFPIPGGGGALGDAKVGGSEAGRGSAPLGGEATKPRDATQTGVVAPTPGAEGPSQTRAVAGQSHREESARSKKQIAIEFLKAEEAALAEEPLPLSRRAQVLRYFTALRQQLEHQP